MLDIEVRPVTGVMGAEVTGIDPSGALDDATVDLIRKAWLDHLVLFFRDVDITPEQQIAFARNFGEIQVPHLPTAHGGPPEMNVLDQTDPKGDGADTWHNDSTYAEKPPMGSVLRVVRVPSVGGDTCFANMYAAYETLSPSLQAHVDGLEAVHDIIPQLVIALERGHTDLDLDEARDRFPPMRHPVVRTHPETGRKALFVNSNHTTHIADVPRAESDHLLSILYAHVKSPELQCRFRWDERSLVFLDNRCLQHYAVPDYHERRILHRVALEGDRPYWNVEQGVVVGTVRVVDEAEIEWHGGDPAMIAEILARGVSFTPEELAGKTREHHLGSETEPELVEVWFEPNTVVQPHAHLHDEIIYVVAGSLILGSRVLEPGSSVFIAGRTLYSFRAGPEGVRFANFRPRSGAGYLSKDEFMAQRGAAEPGDESASQGD